MNVLFRCRVDSRLLAQSKSVVDALGITPGDAVRMFLAEVVRTQRLPLSLALNDTGDLDTKRRNEILGGLDDSKGW